MQDELDSTLPGAIEAAQRVPDLSVLLVCWNNRDYLEPCLRTLYEAGLQSRLEIVVVDNGSSDGSQEMLRREFPEVKLIQNSENLGLGKASNQGIQATNGRYALLLNNDTSIPDCFLDRMVQFMDSTPRAGAVDIVTTCVDCT